MNKPEEEDFEGAEAYARRDCCWKVWRGGAKVPLRAETLKAEVDDVDLHAARAKVCALEAIGKLWIVVKI